MILYFLKCYLFININFFFCIYFSVVILTYPQAQRSTWLYAQVISWRPIVPTTTRKVCADDSNMVFQPRCKGKLKHSGMCFLHLHPPPCLRAYHPSQEWDVSKLGMGRVGSCNGVQAHYLRQVGWDL